MLIKNGILEHKTAVTIFFTDGDPHYAHTLSAEHSGAFEDKEVLYAAAHAIDGDMATMSKVYPGSGWLQIKLDQVHCVKHVISYSSNGRRNLPWTCTQTNCSICEGDLCGRLNVTVINMEAKSETFLPDCKYGDTVKLEATDNLEDGWILVREVAVIAKQGNIPADCS